MRCIGLGESMRLCASAALSMLLIVSKDDSEDTVRRRGFCSSTMKALFLLYYRAIIILSPCMYCFASSFDRSSCRASGSRASEGGSPY